MVSKILNQNTTMQSPSESRKGLAGRFNEDQLPRIPLPRAEILLIQSKTISRQGKKINVTYCRNHKVTSVVFIDLHCCPELLDNGEFSDAASRLCAFGRKHGIKLLSQV